MPNLITAITYATFQTPAQDIAIRISFYTEHSYLDRTNRFHLLPRHHSFRLRSVEVVDGGERLAYKNGEGVGLLNPWRVRNTLRKLMVTAAQGCASLHRQYNDDIRIHREFGAQTGDQVIRDLARTGTQCCLYQQGFTQMADQLSDLEPKQVLVMTEEAADQIDEAAFAMKVERMGPGDIIVQDLEPYIQL